MSPLEFTNIVVIDANFIPLPIQFKIDYLNEIKYMLEGDFCFVVYKQVLDELEAKIKRQSASVKLKKQVDVGLTYLKTNEDSYKIIKLDAIKKSTETSDEFLINQCLDLKNRAKRVILASNDSALRRIAKKNDISVIFLRQKKYLSMEIS